MTDPVPPCSCSICGELLRLPQGSDDDAVCQPCYAANLQGAIACERPTVAPLLHRWPSRRRELDTLNRQRWPLTHPIPLSPGGPYVTEHS
jgi:hypothetical protein